MTDAGTATKFFSPLIAPTTPATATTIPIGTILPVARAQTPTEPRSVEAPKRNTTNPDRDDFDFWGASSSLQMRLREEGYPIPKRPGAPGATAPAQKAGKGKGKGRRKKGESDYALAQAVVEEFEGPIAFVGNSFWCFTVERGWEICDRRVENACHAKMERNADLALLPIIRARMAIPAMEETSTAPIYWERIGGRWDGKWHPLDLTSDQVLYTDSIYSIEADESVSTEGRIIWGPMISTPWSTEDVPDTTEIEEFMAERFPDPEIRRHFQETVSQILQPHVVVRGQIVLWGPPGCGKTTVAMAVAHAPAGALGVSTQQEIQLVKGRFNSNQLLNRFVNVSDDSERVNGWTGWVKRYTSGTFVAEAKYGKPATVAATAKLISTCNEMQDIADASGAMVDRLIPFRLEERITGEWDTEKMGQRYWSRIEIRRKMVEWLMAGLIMLRKRHKFAPPQEWLQAKLEAVAEGDPLECWFSENLCTSEEKTPIKASEILQKMPAEILRNRTGRAIEMTLAAYLRRLFGAHKERVRGEGDRYYQYTGIAWK